MVFRLLDYLLDVQIMLYFFNKFPPLNFQVVGIADARYPIGMLDFRFASEIVIVKTYLPIEFSPSEDNLQ